MRFNLLKSFFIVSAFFIVFSAHSVYAQSCRAGMELRTIDGITSCWCLSSDCSVAQNTSNSNSQNNSTSNSGGQNNTVVNSGGKASIVNPLGFKSITDVLLAILDVLVIFMIPIIILFIIYAGFLYVTARGNQSTIETAHRTLAYAVVGGLLVLGARALLAVIEGTVNQLL